jgi:PAS domain S-box-containing protein
MWPAVLLGGMSIDLWQHRPLIASLFSGAGLAASCALTLWLLERCGFARAFSRGRDVPLFIGAAAIGMALGPTFAYVGYGLSGMGWSGYAAVDWMRWWGNTTTGVLLVAPAFVAASSTSFLALKERPFEVLVWILGLIVCCAVIVLGPGEYSRPVVALVALVLMVVGTMRFGLVLSAFGAFALSLTTTVGFAFRIGAFGQLKELPGLVIVWTFVAALNFVYLSITALLTQRDGAARARLQAEHRYAEIFEGSPQPIWVHQRSTLRFLMINEAALRQYGWSREQMLSMSVRALMPPGEPLPEDLEQITTSPGEPLETRHVTRDGRILDVEVFTRAIDFAGEPAELVFAMDVTSRRAYGSSLIEAIAAEQRRIGQEMHDGLGQELTGLALSARALANRATRERDAIADDLSELASLATSCIQDARLIVQGLSPLTDTDGNLDAALQALAKRSSLSGTPVTFRARHDAPMNIELKVRNHLYRIAQEGVQNALKHAGASAIQIEISYQPDSMRLEILDDGRGLPVDNPNGGGLGMRTMRFRASAIGARLLIAQRADGSGNSVVCELPRRRGSGHATEIAMQA